METRNAQMNKELTLHPQHHGRRTQWHKNLFKKAFLFRYIYHIIFYDVLGLCHVVNLKYILGF